MTLDQATYFDVWSFTNSVGLDVGQTSEQKENRQHTVYSVLYSMV